MNSPITISIIIPAYQVERYLEECVDSVLAQSYPHYEVILVDDGSRDKTPELCDAYAGRDSRIKVIHQQNGGLSAARNAGVRHASGEYVLFLDGDDFYHHPQTLDMLAQRAAQTGADVIQFSYEKYEEDTGMRVPYLTEAQSMPPELNRSEQLEWLFARGLYIASACNKMIRRSLLDESMRFEQGVYSEDIDWCARLLLRAGSFDYIAQQLYSYRQRSTSIRHTINDKKCQDLANNILKCIALAETAEGAQKMALLRYTAFQYGTFFMVQAQAQNPQPECIQRLAPHRKILKHHGKNKKLLCLHVSCIILGYRMTCSLIRRMLSGRA